MPTAAIVSAEALDAVRRADLTSAGRLVVAEAPDLPGARGARSSAAPRALQTARPSASPAPVAINPDPIHRDVPTRYRDAADAAGHETGPVSDVATRLDPADELLAHDVDHVEVPGQEVLEHDPLHPGLGEAASCARAASGVP